MALPTGRVDEPAPDHAAAVMSLTHAGRRHAAPIELRGGAYSPILNGPAVGSSPSDAPAPPS